MRTIIASLFLAVVSAASPAIAQEIAVEEVVFEEPATLSAGNGRFVWVELAEADPTIPDGIAIYGPFRVLDENRAAMIGVTDQASPAAFLAMLGDYPNISAIEMIECPGTEDDRANLQLGRMIRAWGMSTHVPADGSVRSGAVELFLAGARRYADPGAQFAVHSWMDDLGREASDYAASAPENAKYLAYYRQMGMSADQAAAFYAMTNSVPHEQALWLDAGQMARWVALDSAMAGPAG